MPGLTFPPAFPPFPDDVPTIQLVVIDFALLRAGDPVEIERLWKAATELGFWCLKNHGAEELVDVMFDVGERTMELPLDEKMQFVPNGEGGSFGYEYAGANYVDPSGAPEVTEFLNISKNDVLAYPAVFHRTYPRTVVERMESVVRPFVLKGLEVNETILRILNDKLGLPEDALAQRHQREKSSNCEARTLRAPPTVGWSEDQATLGAHTDFGSLSFLHNRLGGLQVLPPGMNGWKYVKPMPGCAICNIGDALAILSGGILVSGLHRVVPPPKPQNTQTRYSQVYFTRPSNDTVLVPLSDESAMIKSAAEKMKYETGMTAEEWFRRRVSGRRAKNYTGPEAWKASKGTEHIIEA